MGLILFMSETVDQLRNFPWLPLLSNPPADDLVLFSRNTMCFTVVTEDSFCQTMSSNAALL
jgi:hypothetical protein